MKKNSKLYIAGHRGMVGSNILSTLRSQGFENIITRSSKELDLRNQAATNEFFAKERPEYVFLCAAKVGGILANDTYKADFIYDNLMIATNVIKASVDAGVKKLLNLGSSCIYPKYAEQPIKEEYLLTGELEPTNEPYALAKIAAIKLCRYFNEQYGTNFISAMPSNLYGIGDNFNLETSHVLPSFIRKFHLAKSLAQCDFLAIRQDLEKRNIGFNLTIDGRSDEDIERLLGGLGIFADKLILWGDGTPHRELLYASDLALAAVFLMEKYDYEDIGEFINIGYGEDMAIKEISKVAADVVGFAGEVSFDSVKPNGTPKKLMDISRIRALGWRPKTSLQDGIALVYSAYLQD